MGTSQRKEISKANPLCGVLTRWKVLVGCGGTEISKV